MMNAIFPVLMEAALRALAAAMVVWAVLRLLRVRNIRAQKAVWTLMLAGALAMPMLMRWQWLPASDAIQTPRDFAPAFSSAMFRLRAAVLPADRIATGDTASPADRAPIPPPFAWSAHPNADVQIAADESEPADRAAIPVSDLQAAIPVQFEPAPLPNESMPARNATATPPAISSLRILDLGCLIYLAVAAALLLRLIVGAFSALRLWMTACPVLAPIASDFAPAGSVRSSPRVSSPANIGSGIVLPADYRDWSDEKLRVVLAHEREHARQGDFYLQLLAGLYSALVWISPLGWLLKRKLSVLGEAMSDRAGLEEAASPSSYAQMLLEFAALPRFPRAGVAMARAGYLASRIERLLNDSTFRQAFNAGGRRAVLALVIAPLALLACAALVPAQAATQSMAPPPQDGQAQTPEASQKTGISNLPAQTIDNQEPPAPSPALNPAAQPSPTQQAPAPAHQAQVPPPAPHLRPAPGQVVTPPVPPVRVQVPPIHMRVQPIPPIYVNMPPAPEIDAEAAKAMLRLDGKWENLYFFQNAIPAAAEPPEATFERTLSVNGTVLQLMVSTGSGNIQLTRGSDSQVHIVGHVKANWGGNEDEVRQIAAHPPIEQTGNIVRVGEMQQNLRGISISYEIEAPGNATLNASSGSGNIGDDAVGDNAKLRTGSGNIHATALRGGFTASTGSGNIYAEQAGEGDVSASTGSGDIELRNVRGGLVARTGSGGIKVGGMPSSPWRVLTGSGNVEISPGSTGFNLNASAGSGGIHVDQPLAGRSGDRHHVTGSVNGGGPEVRISTGSGDIRVH